MRARTGAVRLLLLTAVIVAGCGADQVSKRTVIRGLDEGEEVEIARGFLDLRHARNEHAAFGMLDVIDPVIRRPILIGLQLAGALCALALVLVWRKRRFGVLLPFSLIIGGALGNVTDRILLGSVVDFIHVHYQDTFSWPVFNVADILITVGVGLLLLITFRDGETVGVETAN